MNDMNTNESEVGMYGWMNECIYLYVSVYLYVYMHLYIENWLGRGMMNA